MAKFSSDNWLYDQLSFVESINIEGRNNGFENFLNCFNIDCTGSMYPEEFCSINWKKTEPHFYFFFDYVDNEDDIRNALSNSLFSQHKYAFTWIAHKDPIIKVSVEEFIEKWDDFCCAAVEAFVVISENGKHFLEFSSYYLHSNFEIKVNRTSNECR